MMQNISTTDATEVSAHANRTLNLDAVRSFVAICETGSFRRAAERVNKSPSAISLQINKLEDVLGARLLDRDARRVALTDKGETFLGQARRLLVLSDETLAMFQKSPVIGRLQLSAPHDLGVSLVPDLLRRLAEVHPNVHVDVRLGTSNAVQNGVTEGRTNIALFNDVGASAIPATDLFSEPLVWLALNGGRAAEKTPLPLAVAETGCAWREAALNALQVKNLTYRIAYSSDTSMGQVAALRADLAVAALPRSLADRDLQEVPAHCGLPKLPMTHIRMIDDDTPLARVFVALIVAEMRFRPQRP